MPTENERRTRVYLKKHFKDCIDLCEVHPDIGEFTDATMRLIVASWDMRGLLEVIASYSGADVADMDAEAIVSRARAILQFISKG